MAILLSLSGCGISVAGSVHKNASDKASTVTVLLASISASIMRLWRASACLAALSVTSLLDSTARPCADGVRAARVYIDRVLAIASAQNEICKEHRPAILADRPTQPNFNPNPAEVHKVLMSTS